MFHMLLYLLAISHYYVQSTCLRGSLGINQQTNQLTMLRQFALADQLNTSCKFSIFTFILTRLASARILRIVGMAAQNS